MLRKGWFAASLLCAAVAAGLLITALTFAGRLGLLGMSFYLFALLLPGAVLYTALLAKWARAPSGLLTAVLLSNVLGLALVEGSAWLLARSAVFSLGGTLLVEASAVVALLFVWRRALLARLREGFSSLYQVSWEELGYLGIVVGFATLMLLPLLELYHQGFLVGGDASSFTAIARLDAQAGAWLPLAQTWAPYAPPGALAPGIVMIYALLGLTTGAPPVALAGPFDLLSIILATLGVYLLTKRFSDHPLIVYGVPLVWTVGTTGYGTLFFNNLLIGAYANDYPDSLLSLVGLLVALAFLVDLLRGEGDQWFEVALLSAAIVATTLEDQLTFLVLALAFVLLGLQILWVRGVRWAIPRAVAALVPVAILLPQYLLPGYQQASSSALEGYSLPPSSFVEFNVENFAASYGLLGLLVALGVACTVAFILLVWVRDSWRGTPHLCGLQTGVVALAVVGVLVLYLSVTPVGHYLIGTTSFRFYEFVSLPWIGAVAYGLHRLTLLRLPRLGNKPVVVGIALLFLVSGATGVSYGLQEAGAQASPSSLSTMYVQEAGEWFALHATPGAIAVGDANPGNTAIWTFSDFDGHHLFVIRDRSGLYGQIYQTAAPGNYSMFYANLVLRQPTLANAAAAAQVMSFDYWVFQTGYNQFEIQVFALLPYFALVYSNSQVDIFQFVGAPNNTFFPAVNYCGLSSGLVAGYFYDAYAAVSQLPAYPNSISSVAANNLDGANITYCFDLPSVGEYTLLVHRFSLKAGEYLDVWVNGQLEGGIYFAAYGPNLGNPLFLDLPTGNVSIELTVEGTTRWVDPIDYLLLEPGLLEPSASESA